MYKVVICITVFPQNNKNNKHVSLHHKILNMYHNCKIFTNVFFSSMLQIIA